jgi:hypothetical protein
MSLFGTSGIRGDAESLFTNQFSFDLAVLLPSFWIIMEKRVWWQ